MDESEARIHRTWVQLLIDHNYKEAAAIAVDSELFITWDSEEILSKGGEATDPEAWHTHEYAAVSIAVPSSMYSAIKQTESIRIILERSLSAILDEQVLTFNDDSFTYTCKLSRESLRFSYRMKLMDVEEDWQNVARRLIAESDLTNQGAITKRAFSRRDKTPLEYNEMTFASQSEIRIAQVLEEQGVLFFPLPMAVRSDTGDFFKDHREPDFLVCLDGVFGVLEVSYHPDRFEVDAEKSKWFKKSGILCVEAVPAERCYREPEKVVDEFLEVLAKHRR